MDHKLVLEIPVQLLFEKYSNVRLTQIYEMDLEFKIRVRKGADCMLYYGCNGLGL